MTFKDDFTFSKEGKAWIHKPFIISDQLYKRLDWETVDRIFRNFLDRREIMIQEGKRALFNHAEKIKFFSNEEFADLDFEFGEACLFLQDKNVIGLKLIYSVPDDGTQKIHWKDLYGIWIVDFIGHSPVDAKRVGSFNFEW